MNESVENVVRYLISTFKHGADIQLSGRKERDNKVSVLTKRATPTNHRRCFNVPREISSKSYILIIFCLKRQEYRILPKLKELNFAVKSNLIKKKSSMTRK